MQDSKIKLSYSSYRTRPISFFYSHQTRSQRGPLNKAWIVTLAAILDHSKLEMVMRYAHPTDQNKIAAMRKIEAAR